MADFETNRRKVVMRLEQDGWVLRDSGKHDVYRHPKFPDRAAVIPRHRELSRGVARKIATDAGWRN